MKISLEPGELEYLRRRLIWTAKWKFAKELDCDLPTIMAEISNLAADGFRVPAPYRKEKP